VGTYKDSLAATPIPDDESVMAPEVERPLKGNYCHEPMSAHRDVEAR
jgi:hypothetical protein